MFAGILRCVQDDSIALFSFIDVCFFSFVEWLIILLSFKEWKGKSLCSSRRCLLWFLLKLSAGTALVKSTIFCAIVLSWEGRCPRKTWVETTISKGFFPFIFWRLLKNAALPQPPYSQYYCCCYLLNQVDLCVQIVLGKKCNIIFCTVESVESLYNHEKVLSFKEENFNFERVLSC